MAALVVHDSGAHVAGFAPSMMPLGGVGTSIPFIARPGSRGRRDDDDDDDDEYMKMYRDYNFLCDNKFICEAMACFDTAAPPALIHPAAPPALIHPKNYQLLPKTMSSALASAPNQISNFSKEQEKVLKKWRAS